MSRLKKTVNQSELEPVAACTFFGAAHVKLRGAYFEIELPVAVQIGIARPSTTIRVPVKDFEYFGRVNGVDLYRLFDYYLLIKDDEYQIIRRGLLKNIFEGGERDA